MMLEGILCEQCGQYLDDDEGGYPRLCSVCSTDEYLDEEDEEESEPILLKTKNGQKRKIP